ncbi:hypothetical protein IMSAGC006_02304 [Muribaculaceae bacterium]|nr:hypothetical protein IMSAGC006_02304 [Muribaculaceae bacterium]
MFIVSVKPQIFCQQTEIAGIFVSGRDKVIVHVGFHVFHLVFEIKVEDIAEILVYPRVELIGVARRVNSVGHIREDCGSEFILAA